MKTTMNGTMRVLLLAAAFVGATMVGGWLGVPLVGAAWGALAARGTGSRRAAGRAAVSAALAWAAILVASASAMAGGSPASLGALTSAVGGALQANGVVLVAVTLLFAAALAWSSAAVVGALLGTRGDICFLIPAC
jgi:hypothetical protein